MGVYVHIEEVQAITNTVNAMKPGGLLYIEDYYFVKERADFNDNDNMLLNTRYMFGTRTMAEMREILISNGMEIIEMVDFG